MRTIIQGERYAFNVVAEDGEFFIRADDKLSARYSHINNLNPILSELIGDSLENRFTDSRWDVTLEEGDLFANLSLRFLSHKRFRHYIEDKLKEDRTLGEWENCR